MSARTATRKGPTRSSHRAAVARPPAAAPAASPRPLDIDGLLGVLFGPEPPAGTWLRLAALGGGHPQPGERFYRFSERWRELGSYPHGREPGPAEFPQKETPTAPYFDPVLRASPVATAPVHGDAVHVVWTAVPIRLDARRAGEPFPRLAPNGRERAFEQLARVAVRPTVVVDEGTALVGLWRLARPLDLDHARVTLMRLRQLVGGDPLRAELRDAAVALPGPLAAKIFPATHVTAALWNEESVDPTALDEALLGPHRA